LLLSLLAVASGDTFYVGQVATEAVLSWEANSTWQRSDGSSFGALLPGPDDDVVFVRTNCSAPSGSVVGWTLLLESDVTVRSVSVSSLNECVASFVVGSTGWLRAQRVTASSQARVFLGNGNITAPLLVFQSTSYLAGVGSIAGQVSLLGGSVLFAGGNTFGKRCWPGSVATDSGPLNIDTLLVSGPAVIQGGTASSSVADGNAPATTLVAVGKLVVADGTTSLVFPTPGTYVTYGQVEVSGFVLA
jgi:hypothetical protein